MIVGLQSVVVGKESKVSKRGNAYEVITFMDGSTPVNAMVRCDVSKMPVCQNLDLELKLTFSKYGTEVELTAWSLLN